MLLKRSKWWLWLILCFATSGLCLFFLADILGEVEEDAWYMQGRYWLLGLLCFVFPFIIMLVVFAIQMACLVAAKLEVPLKEVYLSPFIWILFLIVPIIGWILFPLFILYLYIAIFVSLAHGEAENFIEEKEE